MVESVPMTPKIFGLSLSAAFTPAEITSKIGILNLDFNKFVE